MIRTLFFIIFISVPWFSMAEKYPGIADPELEKKLEKVISPEEYATANFKIETAVEELNKAIALLKTAEEKQYAGMTLSLLAVPEENIKVYLDEAEKRPGVTEEAKRIRTKVLEVKAMMAELLGPFHRVVSEHAKQKQN